MEAKAILKNSPYPPRKVRLLADIVRGLPVEKALAVLKLHKKKQSSEKLYKLLLSAIANWKEKNGEDVDDAQLFVKNINVDGGRMLKRIQPAPQGRAHRIRKRSNHVTLVVDDKNAVATVAEPVIEENETADNE
jgi:large subunit ribosomal protein L22